LTIRCSANHICKETIWFIGIIEGKHGEVVSGINLILYCGRKVIVQCRRIIGSSTKHRRKTKNEHFSEMMKAHERRFNPAIVCFDSWYLALDNLKLIRGLDCQFLTKSKETDRSTRRTEV
jgi:hypothetical protein